VAFNGPHGVMSQRQTIFSRTGLIAYSIWFLLRAIYFLDTWCPDSRLSIHKYFDGKEY
jgi:hypothetical protein